MDKSEVVAKIQKVLALANSSSSGEAEMAMKVATRLMAEHAISMRDIEISNVEESIGKFESVIGKYQWQRHLANVVAKHCSCKFTYLTGTKFGYFIGYAEDVSVAEYIFSIAQRAISKEKIPTAPWNMSQKSYNNSYRMSMVQGFSEKLAAMQDEAKAENVGYALVLLSKQSKVGLWFQKNMDTRKGRSISWSTNQEAKNAGRNINIHNGIASSVGGQKFLK